MKFSYSYYGESEKTYEHICILLGQPMNQTVLEHHQLHPRVVITPVVTHRVRFEIDYPVLIFSLPSRTHKYTHTTHVYFSHFSNLFSGTVRSSDAHIYFVNIVSRY